MSGRSETRRVPMYAHDRLSVDAVAYADGGLVIEGQDLRRNTPLAAQGTGIVTHGETRWLREHHVPFALHTW